jgi:uncharacterized protein (TIGR02145 family)
MKSITRFNGFILATCLFIYISASNKITAQPVDTLQAKSVARNFFADRLSRSRQISIKGISSQNIEMTLAFKETENLGDQSSLKGNSQATPLYYIFNVKDKLNSSDKHGFIIISADQRIPSVLGYSFTGEFSIKDQGPALKEWMDHYKEQIIYVIKNNLAPDPKITDEWKNYSVPVALKGTEQITEVAPMLTTKWSQRSYCNNLCPADARCITSLNGHVPAGCTAIAMAQIMNYHKYPASNNPIPSYTDKVNLDADGNPIENSVYVIPDVGVTTYNWSQMPDDINKGLYDPDAPTSEEMVGIDAVSTLIYHCGVAVQMNYGPLESGAGSPLDAFRDYFKYSPVIREVFRSNYASDDDWTDILKDELNNGRPVYYAGYKNDAMQGGHAFVCDGYQDTDPLDLDRFFHFCWGEGGGGGNGYYNLDALTPGSSNYTYQQWAIVGISHDLNPTIADADGNNYRIVTIGTQTWMAENLKVTHYRDGTIIPEVTGDAAWDGLATGAYCFYGDIPANKDIYGAMYNWYAVNTDKLCPAGWHVPSDEEFKTLEMSLGMTQMQADIGPGEFRGTDQGTQMKNTTGWPSGWNGTNTSGFSGLPGGTNSSKAGYSYLHGGIHGFWWCATQYVSGEAWVRGLGGYYNGDETGVERTIAVEKNGMSVRCLKDPTDLVGDGGAFSGDIVTGGEEKWFRFQTGIGGTYAIQTFGSTDTYMYLYNSDRNTLIAEDNNGAGDGHNAKIVKNLSAGTKYYIKIRGSDNSITGNYSISIVSVPSAPTANNASITYDGLTHTAGAIVQTGISIIWYDSPTGGSVTTQPTGKDVGSYKAYAEAVNDATGSVSLNRTLVTLTISKAKLIVTAKNKSSQYSDPLQSLTYEITGFVNGETTSVVTGSPVISTSASQFSTPGEYPVTISPGTLSCINYSFSFVDGIYTIATEDARVDFTGPCIVATASAASGIATITLRTAVQDISATSDAGDDIYPGDIRNAKVRFLNDGSIISGTGTDANGWITPTLINNSDLKTGVIVLNWTVNIGAETDAEYTISTEVTGYYNRNDANDNTVVTVYKPTGDFITGGGFIINPDNTSGTYAGDPGRRTNFGFNVKYNKSGKNLKGNMNIIFRKTINGVIHTFHIKSNSMTSLGVNINNAAAKTAVFVSKVTMKDLSNPLFGYSKGGLTLQVNMTDRGEPGKSDAIAMSVYDGSMLLFSSNWTGTSTAETVLSKGNLLVHSGFSLGQTETQTSTDNPGIIIAGKSEFSLKAYPNPFTDRVYFDLQMQTDSKVLLEIYDLRGSRLATVYNDMVVAFNRYRFEYVPKNVKRGLLVYRLTVDDKLVFTGSLIHN